MLEGKHLLLHTPFPVSSLRSLARAFYKQNKCEVDQYDVELRWKGAWVGWLGLPVSFNWGPTSPAPQAVLDQLIGNKLKSCLPFTYEGTDYYVIEILMSCVFGEIITQTMLPTIVTLCAIEARYLDMKT